MLEPTAQPWFYSDFRKIHRPPTPTTTTFSSCSKTCLEQPLSLPSTPLSRLPGKCSLLQIEPISHPMSWKTLQILSVNPQKLERFKPLFHANSSLPASPQQVPAEPPRAYVNPHTTFKLSFPFNVIWKFQLIFIFIILRNDPHYHQVH